MKLVDTDADVSEQREHPPIRVTASRPEKRRAAVSLLFTVGILAGTVIAVFAIFPARHNQVITSALAAHRHPGNWDLVAPDHAALVAWATAILGHQPPVPDAPVVGARRLDIFKRGGAVVRYRIGADEVTYFVQKSRDLEERRIRKKDKDDVVIEQWQNDEWTVVAIGPIASADAWRPVLGVP